ncbi:hypothetical protein WICMUC_005934 [Wickerhamomyces mucosus]|uniref:Uncharacterized protein n=1 Tax=Wickerhamomyces mucosus TaxID=1378264 RepID=A0A9P8P1D7_9ASCO|nr:hypothetical protein WICMUC_005934 [Wickerhamomyces mucosus]
MLSPPSTILAVPSSFFSSGLVAPNENPPEEAGLSSFFSSSLVEPNENPLDAAGLLSFFSSVLAAPNEKLGLSSFFSSVLAAPNEKLGLSSFFSSVLAAPNEKLGLSSFFSSVLAAPNEKLGLSSFFSSVLAAPNEKLDELNKLPADGAFVEEVKGGLEPSEKPPVDEAAGTFEVPGNVNAGLEVLSDAGAPKIDGLFSESVFLVPNENKLDAGLLGVEPNRDPAPDSAVLPNNEFESELNTDMLV